MGIMLGNVTVQGIQDRIGYALSSESIEFMESHHQQSADVRHGVSEWHCFDAPFVLVCGTYALAAEIYSKFTPRLNDYKCSLEICITEPKREDCEI